MKKVGLVTYYGDNYGGQLQAFALQNILTTENSSCDIIQYSVESDQQPFTRKDKLRAFIKNPFIYCRRGLAWRLSRKNQERRAQYFDAFRKKYLRIAPNTCRHWQAFYQNPPLFDMYWCGSDQIWNPLLTDSVNPIYFLDFVPEGYPRCAYAPSIGITDVPQKYHKEMRKYLSKMTCISVREKNSVETIRKISGRDAENVLDPTLLLTGDEWRTHLRKNDRPKKTYIFCYLFGDMDYIRKVKQYYRKKTGYRIVCCPYNDREIYSRDMCVWAADPFDFVELIAHAQLVITDSFHATAFACNLNVPFVSLLRVSASSSASMHSRLFSLLEQLHCEERIIKPQGTHFPEIAMDFSEINQQLKLLRLSSYDYLNHALDMNSKN